VAAPKDGGRGRVRCTILPIAVTHISEIDCQLAVESLSNMSDPDIRKLEVGTDSTPSRAANAAEAPWGVERRGVARLFLDYYGLSEQPFGVTPDLRFLYLGSKHRQALDVLNYGTELNRGFLTLIAKPGMGKTSLLFQYLEGLREKARTVFLFQTDCDSADFMRYLLADLGLDGSGMGLPAMRAMLSQVLLHEMNNGRPFVLVIDEAQNLDEKVLESIRLLSNFETPWMKLMQIVLAGQPQLADKLAQPSLAQLRQRISFSVRIDPFTREEVDQYVDHRLWIAGFKGTSLFTDGARELLAERSEGIPRTINNMCFCAMSFAWAMKQRTIGREMMQEVLADLQHGCEPESRTSNPPIPHSVSVPPVRTQPFQQQLRIEPPMFAQEPVASPEGLPAPEFEVASGLPAFSMEVSPSVAPHPIEPEDATRPKNAMGLADAIEPEDTIEPAILSLPGELFRETQSFSPVGFTIEPRPARGAIVKIMIASMLLIVLVWGGMQFDVSKWIGHPLRTISDAARNYLDPVPTSPYVAPASAGALANSVVPTADEVTSSPNTNSSTLPASPAGHN
jgi:general secretion pathway protein A